MSWRPALSILGLAAGCTSVVSEVVIKDPAAVSVHVANADGVGAEILPVGAAPTEIDLPRGTPPYTEGVMFTASAIRRDGGSILLRCDACSGTPTLDALAADGRLTTSAEFNVPRHPMLRLYGDLAVISHVEYPYVVPAGKSVSHHVAFEVDLVTPTSNLVSARRDGGETHTGGYVLTATGVVLLVTAGFLFATSGHNDRAVAFDILGVYTALFGLSSTVVGISLATNAPVHEQEWPR